jgi:hypothetical protein
VAGQVTTEKNGYPTSMEWAITDSHNFDLQYKPKTYRNTGRTFKKWV